MLLDQMGYGCFVSFCHSLAKRGESAIYPTRQMTRHPIMRGGLRPRSMRFSWFDRIIPDPFSPQKATSGQFDRLGIKQDLAGQETGESVAKKRAETATKRLGHV